MSDRFTEINISKELKDAYLEYSMSVIVGRALPDAKDGLKPVHRRILFAMSEMGLYHNKPHKKSASVIGEVLGKFHPHGDQSIYNALVRMAQEFSLRYPLVDGQGNFGSIDGDPPAAYRYTEARLSKIAAEMLVNIKEDTVNMIPNFDARINEPSVMPARIPNLLINGASGIAVGMATNIPPHNLTEVIEGAEYLIEHKDANIDELMQFIKGPDFPTQGVISGAIGIRDAYMTGRGSIQIQGRANYETTKNGREKIIITELPYQVNKANLICSIAKYAKEKRIEGIHDLKDESDRNGIRICLEIKKGYDKKIVLNNIYKYTQLRTNFGIIMLAIVNGVPKILNLKEILNVFIEHRKEIITRRSQFRLNKAEKRAHIVEGLKKAIDHIDEIIEIIKSGNDVNDAANKLINRFSFSVEQANAILEIKLSRLTKLERSKLDEEYEKLIKDIAFYKSIIESEPLLLQEIKKELIEIREKYGDDRLTEIKNERPEDLDIEDLIADEKVVVFISNKGYIKRMSLSTYKNQKRGGKGIMGIQTAKEDFAKGIFVTSTHNYILIFTDKGKAYWLKIYKIPVGGRLAKGRAIINLINCNSGEKVKAIVPVKSFDDDKYLILVTNKGIIKRLRLSDFSHPRITGIIFAKLGENEVINEIKITSGSDSVIIVTKNGMAIHFNEDEVRVMGRSAHGVRGISLKKNDEIIGMVVAHRNDNLLVITDKGFGKQTGVKQYRKTHRGGKGVIAIKTDESRGNVIAIKETHDNDELIFITKTGNVVRMKSSEIKVIGRNTKGVRIIRLKEDDTIVDVEKITPDV
ncbi:DNA gyrase subunit A [candidate division TA06 bacterium]|uniref:DNA gyrase subunit A n=1 Tax=candidate division TA06 bacterium TaxID=2250710 RepID=A0A660SNG5_UNCT6|nr:MAG: DNA gyrase subunit A [candidate division TA06 bacterium]